MFCLCLREDDDVIQVRKADFPLQSQQGGIRQVWNACGIPGWTTPLYLAVQCGPFYVKFFCFFSSVCETTGISSIAPWPLNCITGVCPFVQYILEGPLDAAHSPKQRECPALTFSITFEFPIVLLNTHITSREGMIFYHFNQEENVGRRD